MRRTLLSIMSFLLAFSATYMPAPGPESEPTILLISSADAQNQRNYGRIFGTVKIKDKNERLRVGLRGTELYKWTDTAGRFEFNNLQLGTHHIEIYCPNRRILYDEIVELSVIFKDYSFQKVFEADWCEGDAPRKNAVSNENFGRIYGTIRDTCAVESKRFRVGLSNTDIYVWTDINGSYEIENLPLSDYQVNLYEADTRKLIHVEQVNLTRAFYHIPVNFAYCGSESQEAAVTPNRTQEPSGPGVIVGKVTCKNSDQNFFKVRLNGMEIDRIFSTDTGGNFRFDYLPLGSYTASVFDLNRNFMYSEEIELTKLFPRYTMTYTADCQGHTSSSPESGRIYGRIADEAKKVQNYQVELYPLGTKIFVDKHTGDYAFYNLPLREYMVQIYNESGQEITNQSIQLSPEYTEVRFDHLINESASKEVDSDEIEIVPNGETAAKSGSIIGTIKEEGAEVHKFRVGLSGTNHYTWTSENGTFAFKNLKLGHYQLVIYDRNQKLLKNVDFHLTQVFPVQELTESFELSKVVPASMQQPDPRGAIAGNLRLKGAVQHNIRVGLSGTDRFVWTNSVDGSFRLDNLDMGYYKLVAFSEDQQLCLEMDIHLTPIFPTYKVDKVITCESEATTPPIETGSIFGRITRDGQENQSYRIVLAGTDKIETTDTNGNFQINDLGLGHYALQFYDYYSHERVAIREVELTKVFPDQKIDVQLPAKDKPVSGRIYGKISVKGDCAEPTFRVQIADHVVNCNLDGTFELANLEQGIYLVRIYNDQDELVHARDLQLTPTIPQYQLNVTIDCKEKAPANPKPTGTGMIYGQIITDSDCGKSAYRVAVGDTSVVTSNADGSFEIRDVDYGSYLIQVYDMSQKLVHAVDVRLNSVFTSYKLDYKVPCKKAPATPAPQYGMVYVKISHCGDCSKSLNYRVALGDTAISTQWDGTAEIRLPYGAYPTRVFDENRAQVFAEDVMLSSIFPTYDMTLNLDCNGNPCQPPKNKPGRISGRVYRENPEAADANFYKIRLAGTDRTYSTDISGNFEIRDLELGLYHIVVYDKDQVNVYNQNVELTRTFPHYFMKVNLDDIKKASAPAPKEGKGKITGRITKKDASSHNFRVALVGTDHVVSTNPSGVFTISGLEYGNYHLIAYDDNQQPCLQKIVNLNEIFPVYHLDQECDVKADKPATVPVSAGGPGIIKGVIEHENKDKRPPFRVVVTPVGNEKGRKVVSTDATGYYEIDNLELGPYSVRAYENPDKAEHIKDVLLSDIYPAYTLNYTFKMDKKDKPKPAAKGRIYGVVKPSDKSYQIVISGTNKSTRTTAITGRFELTEVPYGYHTLSVFDMKTQKREYDVDIVLSEVFPEFELEVDLDKINNRVGDGEIYGNIVDPTSPNKEFVVLVQPGNKFTRTDPQNAGVYEIKGLPWDDYQVSVYDSKHKFIYSEPVKLTTHFPKFEVSYTVPKPSKKFDGRIYGKVLIDGAVPPCSDDQFTIVLRGEDAARTTIYPNSTGDFSFENLPYGKYWLEVFNDDRYLVFEANVELTDVFKTKEIIKIFDADEYCHGIFKPGKIYGNIVDETRESDDQRIFEVRVYYNNRYEVVKTDKTGYFSIDNLDLGTYEIMVLYNGKLKFEAEKFQLTQSQPHKLITGSIGEGNGDDDDDNDDDNDDENGDIYYGN